MEDLRIGGVSCHRLAEEFSTPLFIYDERKIIQQATAAVAEFRSAAFDTEVIYASKAFTATALFEMLGRAGLGFDVVSGGELYCAVKAQADMSKVYFHGNNKSDEEINMALDVGVGYFVVDNVMECERLVAAAGRKQRRTKALLRINPGISAHTHEYIVTAAPDSKFGIHIEDRRSIEEAMRILSHSSFVEHAGFHSHIGSQIMSVDSFENAVEAMIGFLAELKTDYNIDNMELDIGGGFGIRYTEQDNPVPIGDLCRELIKHTERCIKRKGVNISKLITEPGRAIVGEAGCTLYTVGDMKKSGDKNYVFVDGGMSDNIRPALYNAEYTAEVIRSRRAQPERNLANREARAFAGNAAGETGGHERQLYCIAGKNCESGDVLIKNAAIDEPQTGDLLMLHATGAYGYSMASNYNRLQRPAVVFAANGKTRLIIRRETYEDMYGTEVREQEQMQTRKVQRAGAAKRFGVRTYERSGFAVDI